MKRIAVFMTLLIKYKPAIISALTNPNIWEYNTPNARDICGLSFYQSCPWDLRGSGVMWNAEGTVYALNASLYSPVQTLRRSSRAVCRLWLIREANTQWVLLLFAMSSGATVCCLFSGVNESCPHDSGTVWCGFRELTNGVPQCVLLSVVGTRFASQHWH